MVFLSACLLSTGQAIAASDALTPQCPSDRESLERWRAVRQSALEAEADRLALELAECLASRSPELRDRIAYEVLTYWLRQEKLKAETVAALREKLIPWLARGGGEAGSDAAIVRAFSALVLSELVRHDTIHGAWPPEQIASSLKSALAAFTAERDYRGLVPEIGWIHCVAHEADLLWRLVLHPKTSGADHAATLEALSGQIGRLGLPAYTHNEGDRLSRVASAVVARGELPAADVSAWITSVGQPGSLESWRAAFLTPDGMAQLHNVKSFLRALRQQLSQDSHENLTSHVDSVLAELP